MSHVSPFGRLYAEAGAFTTRHPSLRLLVDRKMPERILPLGFHVAKTRAYELAGAPTFRGDAKASRERARWPIGVIAVDSDRHWRELNAPNRRGSDYVLVFTVGEFALAGIVPWELRPHQGSNERLYGARVGPHDVTLTAAIGMPNGELIVPEGSVRVLQAIVDNEGRYLPQHRDVDDAVPPEVLLY